MKLSVLVADDHALYRDGLESMLSAHDSIGSVAMVDDGSAVLSFCVDHSVDLIIMDHDMPGMTGLDTVSRLKQMKYDARIIVLTGFADESVIRDFHELAVAGMVLKAESTDILADAVDAIVAGRSYRSPGVQQVIDRIEIGRKLTGRERQVMRHVAAGLSTKEISRVMGIAPKTVDNHRTNLMAKLGLHNTAEVVAYALKQH